MPPSASATSQGVLIRTRSKASENSHSRKISVSKKKRTRWLANALLLFGSAAFLLSDLKLLCLSEEILPNITCLLEQLRRVPNGEIRNLHALLNLLPRQGHRDSCADFRARAIWRGDCLAARVLHRVNVDLLLLAFRKRALNRRDLWRALRDFSSQSFGNSGDFSKRKFRFQRHVDVNARRTRRFGKSRQPQFVKDFFAYQCNLQNVFPWRLFR